MRRRYSVRVWRTVLCPEEPVDAVRRLLVRYARLCSARTSSRCYHSSHASDVIGGGSMWSGDAGVVASMELRCGE